MCNRSVWLIIQWSLCWGRWPRAKTSTCRQTVSPSPHHCSSPSPLLLATSPLSPPPLLCSPPLFLPHSLCKDEKPCWCWWSPPCPPPPPPPPCKVSVMDRSICSSRLAHTHMLKIGIESFEIWPIWRETLVARLLLADAAQGGALWWDKWRRVSTFPEFFNIIFLLLASPVQSLQSYVQLTLSFKRNHFQHGQLGILILLQT